MARDAVNGKARVYYRRKWTIPLDPTEIWVQIGVWVIRHADGTFDEALTPAAACDLARSKSSRKNPYYAI